MGPAHMLGTNFRAESIAKGTFQPFTVRTQRKRDQNLHFHLGILFSARPTKSKLRRIVLETCGALTQATDLKSLKVDWL